MGYRFEKGQIYRMPTHFGPAPGPRQMPVEMPINAKLSPRRLSVAASFLTGAQCVERHLPDGFTLAGEPVVTVEFHYMSGIDWLAGRGYTMIHVGWPATFKGRQSEATGRFLAVVWENLADPIISGRDEIGHPKLYADIEPPRLEWQSGLCRRMDGVPSFSSSATNSASRVGRHGTARDNARPQFDGWSGDERGA
jgi:hypothetical protein